MVDLGRLARAVHLDAERVGPGRWRVTGGASPHTVERLEGGGLICDCPDASFGRACKHALAVRLCCGDLTVVRALRELVPPPARRGRAPSVNAVYGPNGGRGGPGAGSTGDRGPRGRR